MRRRLIALWDRVPFWGRLSPLSTDIWEWRVYGRPSGRLFVSLVVETLLRRGGW